MIPVYTYRPTHHDWELTQDGYVLGYIRRYKGDNLDSITWYGASAFDWLASGDGEVWHGWFGDRKSARQFLQSDSPKITAKTFAPRPVAKRWL